MTNEQKFKQQVRTLIDDLKSVCAVSINLLFTEDVLVGPAVAVAMRYCRSAHLPHLPKKQTGFTTQYKSL